VWVKRAHAGYATYHSMTQSEYVTRFNELWASGHRVVHTTAYATPSGTRYAAIWERLPGSWANYINMSWQDYQTTYEQMAASGLVMTQLASYGNRFSAVWHAP
jgi:hypothetical protein